MSFAERITTLMQRPGQENAQPDDIPWYLTWAGRGLGIIASFFGILFGLFNCLGIFTFDISCVVSGILQMIAGFIVLVIEAPCCCIFIDFTQVIAAKADARPYWQRAALYCGIALPPVILCIGLGSLFGCGLIFGTGVLYGMMGIGKKASVDEMRSTAATVAATPNSKIIPTGGMRSNLVNNAQPISVSGPPAFDSNV